MRDIGLLMPVCSISQPHRTCYEHALFAGTVPAGPGTLKRADPVPVSDRSGDCEVGAYAMASDQLG